MNRQGLHTFAWKASLAFLLSSGIALSASAGVAQTPLLLGGGNVPGNLALVPSVEWPTILSVANTGSYSSARTYVGYFDANKCYEYDASNEWFYPVAAATARRCGAGKRWSGNFLNWAGTPTIDPFRSALTGGLRYRDEVGLTVLEKARHTGQSAAGNRMSAAQGLVPAAEIQDATPAAADWTNFYIRLQGQGIDMLFSNWNDKIGGDGSTGTNQNEWIAYNPGTNAQWNNNRLVTAYTPPNGTVKSVYRVRLRVKVCDPSVGLEPNCKQYGANYKPEGLIQQYSDSLRYSVFGYLNDESQQRDGGVLRAGQKFVGPLTRGPGDSGDVANPNAEWSPTTGVLVTNPNPDDVTATTALFGRTVANSGVINYLNKFGQLTTNNHKSNDPVSELYYAAFRYFRDLGNVPAYSTPTPGHASSPDNATKDRWLDGFPVVTDWTDPIQYACQKNVILGIGDTNTHADRNLPGATTSNREPAAPSQVSADPFDVAAATAKVGALEGVDVKANSSEMFGDCCSNNSAYIAGMAYHGNTTDLRADLSGKQLLSTHWVDVRENQVLKGRAKNQYWLAAKYGGFKVPSNVEFGDAYDRTAALPESWWTDGDHTEQGDLRPRNFYVASDATLMVASLKQAFANIAAEVRSTTGSLATNSTRLDTDTAVFQSLLDSSRWSGDLLAKQVASNGAVAEVPAWSAAARLDALSSVDNRNILTIAPLSADSTGGPLRSTSGRSFTWSGIGSDLQALLTLEGDPSGRPAQRLDYLRGDRSQEISVDDQTRPFRQRTSRLGDIVNSDPQFIHTQDFGYARLSWEGVGAAYAAFRASSAYQNRTPLVVVGANDGMLHGFDASLDANTGGRELFAYVPNGVFANLHRLADPDYSHRYYVDGTPRVGDAWLGSGTGWRTLAIGTTGAGGSSVFALDVTDPSSVTSSSVLWEFSHPALGYAMGQPALVALPNQQFGVIVTSGYHDTAPANGKVWVLDAGNGSLIKEITLPTTGGLGAVLASDTNADTVADRLYVPDTLGNVWRIDLPGSNTNGWSIPSSLGSNPLFVAKYADGTRQAITAPLASAFNEKNEHMVFFGTGSFYRTGDNEVPSNPPVESFYGIIDRGSAINGRSTLLQQTILREATLSSGEKARALSQNTLADNQNGWYIDLAWQTGEGATGALGERVVAKPTLRSERVIFTTMTPDRDPCASGGSSWVMAVNLLSGGRLNYVYFDTSGDGDLDEDDTFTQGEENIPWSGISDPDLGVSKGVTPLFKWLCFAGSSGGTPQCIPVAGSQRFGRHSWREVRSE